MVSHARIYNYTEKDHYRWPRGIIIAACALIILVLIAGGGTRPALLSDLLIQLASLPVLAIALFQLPRTLPRDSSFALILLAAAVLLPVLQLVPLPPGVWSALPGRVEIADLYRTVGVSLPWHPLSLDPDATRSAGLTLVPAVTLFLVALQATSRERLTLLLTLGVGGMLSALFGVSQAVQGFGPPPWLSDTAFHEDTAIGFFVNRNHFAALMYSLLPIAAALILIYVRGHHHHNRTVTITISVFLFVVAMIGLSASFSRAGVALGVAGCLGALLLVWTTRHHMESHRWIPPVFVVILLVLLVAQQAGLVELIRARSAIDEQRAAIAETTLTAIRFFLPFGTGLGTFVPVFQRFEPVTNLSPFYVNHAHNDWLELLLEGGLPAGLLLLAFLVWFGHRTWSCWKAPRGSGPAVTPDLTVLLTGRSASLTLLLLLVHGLVDYPLRTTALMAVFALCCGLLVPPRPPRLAR